MFIYKLCSADNNGKENKANKVTLNGMQMNTLKYVHIFKYISIKSYIKYIYIFLILPFLSK